MKAKRQTEAVLNSATMLDGFGGHVNGTSRVPSRAHYDMLMMS